METKSSLGESVLQDSLRPAYNNKLAKPVGIILLVWFIAMASLLGVHYFYKKKPQINKAGIMKIHAKFNTLSDEEKIRVKYSELGIIELANGDLRVVDSRFESKEGDPAALKGLGWRRIEFAIKDPLFLERQTMIKEALRTLNNAERRCFTDRHAAIIYDDGSYFLIIDPKIYADYVSKYGTECKSCSDRKGNSLNNPK
jgi:hypothetical protein